MKLNKKKVFALALAVCLIATLSLSSLAWFTAEDSVTNNFYVGDSNTDPDDVFGVDVWETVDGEEYGKDTADEGATYEDILPGQKLNKEPVLENTGIHPQYVRAIVTVSDAYILREAMEGAWGDADKFLAGTNAENWTLTDILYTTDNELVYVYYYNWVLEPGEITDSIFNEVVIPTGLTLEQAQEMEDFSVSILGQVIQSEYLLVESAQEAFEKYWDAEGTIAGYTDDEILANGKTNEEVPETVDVYYTVGEENSAEVSLDNVTASVKDAVVYVPAEYYNSSVIINGGNFTVAEGGKVVKTAEPGGQCVYVTAPVTVNGIEYNSSNFSEFVELYIELCSTENVCCWYYGE